MLAYVGNAFMYVLNICSKYQLAYADGFLQVKQKNVYKMNFESAMNEKGIRQVQYSVLLEGI